MSSVAGYAAAARRQLGGQLRDYAPGEDRPLAGYTGALAAYLAACGAVAGAARRRGRTPPGVGPWDVVLLGVASHKLSRMLAKSPVTSPLRAPFTRYAGVSGEAELAEEVRGRGARKVMGELLTCPFCLGQWTSTGLVAGLLFAPRATRLVAAVFAVHAVSDILQFGYAATQDRVIANS